MKRNIVVGTMVVAAAIFAGQAVYAQPLAISPTGTHSMFKDKMVSFSLRNDSKEAIAIKAGDRDLTLEPGKTVSIKLAEGTQLVATNTTSNHASGSVIMVVSSTLSDSTLALN